MSEHLRLAATAVDSNFLRAYDYLKKGHCHRPKVTRSLTNIILELNAIRIDHPGVLTDDEITKALTSICIALKKIHKTDNDAEVEYHIDQAMLQTTDLVEYIDYPVDYMSK